MTPNPFQLVYDALWQMMASRADLADLVKVGNHISFGDPAIGDPFKRSVAIGDLPEVVLIPAGMDANLFSTSSSSNCTRRYQWLLSTGDLRIHEGLHPVEWAIFCGMCDWQTVLTALEWPANSGRHFVKMAEIENITEGKSDPERNRGIVGWSAVWTCSIQMYFSTADLIASAA